MPASIPLGTLEKFTTFGDLLRYLRRRASLTQLELSIQVGYSDTQISRLEQNLRLPDIPTIEARFINALCLEDEPKVVDRLLDLAANVRREDAPALGLCPYKGLDYFDEADADLFIGREALSSKLAESVLALAACHEAGSRRFFAIVGASGSGKSSLLRAGLVPALRWKKASANWSIHLLTPTAHPIQSLCMSLTRETGSFATTAALMDDLNCDRRSLSLYVQRKLKPDYTGYVLLAIDQFEELFALCRSEEERIAFVDNLLTAASDETGRTIVVIALRADFYAHCAGYPHLREALAQQQEYIGAMSDEELRRAVEEPARRGQWEFEPGLVDLILHDVGHEPGALPLLSHALLETWQRRHGRTLTLSGYFSAGGVRGAIAETAEAVFVDQFTREQQAIARRIFLRLTELGDETATGDTRRRATFSELILRPEKAAATQAVLKALADARLITTSEDSAQVAHEALIREWPTLRGWLEDDREGLRLHRRLTEAAQEWIAADREPGMLYRGARLAQALEWSTTSGEDMNALEKEFLAASVALNEREVAEREAQVQRELEAARRLAEAETQRAEAEARDAKKLRQRAIYLGLALAAALLLVVASIFLARQASQNAALAGQNRNTAEIASTQAIAQQILAQAASTQAIAQQVLAQAASTQAVSETHTRATAEAGAVAEAALNRSLRLAGAAQQAKQAGQGDLALALALKAVDGSQPPPEALTALRSVAYSPGTRKLLTGHGQSVKAVALSPDNLRAFSGSCATQVDEMGNCQAGELTLWDLAFGKELRRWTAHSGWVNTVTFSQDGQLLISGGEDNSIIVWDAKTGTQVRSLIGHTGGITGLGIEAGTGDLLSGSTDGTLILWDIQSGAILRRFVGKSPVTALAVASAEPFAVSGCKDGTLTLWDLNSTKSIRTIPGDGMKVWALAMAHDGSWLLAASAFTLWKYNGITGQVEKQQSWGGSINQLALSSDESFVMIGENVLSQFDLASWTEQRSFFGDSNLLTALSISRDQPMALAGYWDGSIREVDLAEALDIQRTDTGLHLNNVAVSPDGKNLLLGSISFDEKQPVLWDVAQARAVKTYPGFVGATAPSALAISPDGKLAAAGGGYIDKPVYSLMVWDLESGNVHCNFEGITLPPRSVAFSPDSRWLLSGTQVQNPGEKNELVLWDLKTCQPLLRIPMGEWEDVTSIAFSANGKWAAMGTAMAFPPHIILWDLSTGHELKRFIFNQFVAAPIYGLAFGPGDKTILSSVLGTLFLTDIESGQVIRRYIGHTTYVWKLALSSDAKYVISGTTTEAILWDFATGQELHRLSINGQQIYSVAFSYDSQIAYVVGDGGTLVQWKIAEITLPELLDWIQANRYIHSLSCDEKKVYRVEPLCEPQP